MPIKIIEGLPVRTKLQQEQVYTIEASRAITQDIRPLKILILNLMPLKETTRTAALKTAGQLTSSNRYRILTYVFPSK
ncbi:homoserine O-succinyltransferase [Jeotgalicoccus sp. WY2]|uniref:homoserine O-acetyltransferase/O-succinyltransferase family protein n=1 Tax=Jeotgalicoccus sp. WY2 TaxID=2708346 RepID=UPI0035302075